jgi:hypothetical protein
MSLQPESQFVVALTNGEFTNRRPNGAAEHMRFDDLRAVIIETNARGPFAPDVWWILLAENETACIFPQGATGEDAVREKLFALPGFNMEAFIEAMSSTSNKRFLCWERGKRRGAAGA